MFIVLYWLISEYSLRVFWFWPSVETVCHMSQCMRFPKCGMCDQQGLRPACAYAQSDQSLCKSLEYSMSVKLLTQHHLEVLSLTGGCRGSSESTLVKMSNCWKSHAAAHIGLLSSCVVCWWPLATLLSQVRPNQVLGLIRILNVHSDGTKLFLRKINYQKTI